jgi:hypothetical protein
VCTYVELDKKRDRARERAGYTREEIPEKKRSMMIWGRHPTGKESNWSMRYNGRKPKQTEERDTK